jgi:hypothetical protein
MTTYIKNKGITQTFFSDNHHKKFSNNIKWDADYDGKRANIKVDVNDNGKKNKYHVQLNNQDLANLLSIPAVNKPLDSRLKQDFLNDYDFLDEEDVELLPKIEFQPEPMEPCYQPCNQPEPALFRVNIPQSNDKKASLTSQFPTPCPYKSDVCSLQIPNPNPNPKPEDSLLESILPKDSIKRPKLTKREKEARLKTPSPKTMRIHYTSARGTRRKTSSNNKQNSQNSQNSQNKQPNFIKFFNKLF